MMKYDMLVRILDRIREEASPHWRTRYQPHADDVEKIAHARSLAFIHLYLKVTFGLLEFDEREHYITDGSYDGGIDGYYIDKESRTIHLIQAKFRTKAHNFENKSITLEEILAMDVTRILDGETCDDEGNAYNGKIKQLQREISNLPEVTRYRHNVVLLANLESVSQAKLKLLTGGYPVDVFNYERSYNSLVFPVVSGTYFNGSDLNIAIDLSNKSPGSKIGYTVQTRISACEITVLFVPTLEIARLMNKYRNSILKFNPRSYLDLEGQAVNRAIRETITKTDTNEFALFNNGITMMSDETYISEKIGQKNRAQLTVKNPQIINGGQTSYTLSRIYTENAGNSPEEIFAGKEVLLKVITLIDSVSDEDKVQLIEEISNATNKQTPVINADRFSNEVFHKRLQHAVFQRFGLLYERKRGEFADGIREKYVSGEAILERNLLLRVYYASNGNILKAVQKRLFQKNQFSDINLSDTVALDRFYVGYQVFRILDKGRKPQQKQDPAIYGKMFAYLEWFFDGTTDVPETTHYQNLKKLEAEWPEFVAEMRRTSKYGRIFVRDKATGERHITFSWTRYYRDAGFARDMSSYFAAARRETAAAENERTHTD